MTDLQSYPAEFFDREDESDDSDFYLPPRLVVHIDESTIESLTSAEVRDSMVDSSMWTTNRGGR